MCETGFTVPVPGGHRATARAVGSERTCSKPGSPVASGHRGTAAACDEFHSLRMHTHPRRCPEVTGLPRVLVEADSGSPVASGHRDLSPSWHPITTAGTARCDEFSVQ